MNSAAAYEKVVMERLEERVGQERIGLIKRLTSFTKLSFHMGIAISFYETAIKLDPENHMAAAWFSDFYLQMALIEDAIKVLEKGLQSHWDPDLAHKLADLYVNGLEEVSAKKQTEFLSKAEGIMKNLYTFNITERALCRC